MALELILEDYRRISQELRDVTLRLEKAVREQEGALSLRDSAADLVSDRYVLEDEDKPSPSVSRRSRPALPDPRKVRKILKNRDARARYFGGELFADPAWDMLLDLAAAAAEYKRVSVTSLCIAARIPSTTALRWIGEMEQMGLIKRIEDPSDRRRAFLELTDRARDAMSYYFEDIENESHILSPLVV